MNSRAPSVAGLKATSIGDCRLFCLFTKNWSHGTLGLLQHNLPLADISAAGSIKKCRARTASTWLHAFRFNHGQRCWPGENLDKCPRRLGCLSAGRKAGSEDHRSLKLRRIRHKIDPRQCQTQKLLDGIRRTLIRRLHAVSEVGPAMRQLSRAAPSIRQGFGVKAIEEMSNYLAQNRLAFGLDRSVAVVTWAAKARFRVLPCRVIARAGLRWCGGWRRVNLRGSHDQA
jgi:hypothetical protein